MCEKPSYEQLEQQLLKMAQEREQMAQMLSATRAIPLSRSFVESARHIYDICKSMIGSACGYVALLSEDGQENELLFLDDGDLPCSVDPNLPMPIQGLRSLAYASRQAVYENQFMESDWADLMPSGHVLLENVMFSPLNIGNKTVGVMGFANKPEGFTDQDKKIAQSFGDIAALALQHGKLQDDLKKNERFFQNIIENISDTVLITDDDGQFVYVCPNTRLIFGYDPEEILALRNVVNLFARPLFDRGELHEKKELSNIQTKISDKNHQIHYLLVNVKKVAIGKGTTLYTCRDISDRKQAEKNLEKSENRFRTIVNVLPQFIAYTDKELRYGFVNKTYEEKLGINSCDILNKSLKEVIGSKAFNKATPYIERVMKGERVNYNERFEYATGQTLDIEGTLIPHTDKNGDVKGYFSVLTDVSQYMNVQKELQESETRQRQIIDNSSAGYFFINTKGQFQNVNAAWLNLHNYTRKQDIIGKHFSTTQLHGEYEKANGLVKTIMADKKPLAGEFSRKCKDGAIGYHSYTIRPVIKEDRLIGVEGFLIDTTQRYLAEKALAESREIFEKAFQNSPVLITISSVEDGKYLEVNDTFVQTTGFTKQDAIGKTSVEIGFIPARERKRLKQILDREGRIQAVELKLFRSDGSAMFCSYSGEVIHLAGTPRLLSIAADITQRAQQEKMIEKKQTELEAHTAKLEQMNTALNVLIDHRNDKMKNRENEIIDGFKRMILPYFDLPITDKSRDEISLIFNILKANISEILFSDEAPMDVNYKVLTPMEIQVANLIKYNKSTKEIANILNISTRAVYFHRENIRKKLNLSGKKKNLKTFLQTKQ